MSATTEQIAKQQAEQRCRRCKQELEALEREYDQLDRQAWQFEAERDRAGNAFAVASEWKARAAEPMKRWKTKLEFADQTAKRQERICQQYRQRVAALQGNERKAEALEEAERTLREEEEKRNDAVSVLREAKSEFASAKREYEQASVEVERTQGPAERAKRKAVTIQARKNEVGSSLYRKRNECDRACDSW